jgi:transcriptional regulator with XRE-family HTH domain
MRSSQELATLRERAVQLRRQGKSRRQIKEILGPMSNATLNDALEGEPPPEWTRRPRAKDDLRARARELRGQGLDYEEIAGALGVAKSSVSLWVRDLPRPAKLSYDECRRRSAEGARRYWAAERPVREARRAATREVAGAQIGRLTDRELLIAGAIAYWCEGAKSKPYRLAEQVNFINSDPGLIMLFLRFLDRVGVSRASIRYRVHIHETAEVEAATRYWSALVGAAAEQFHRPNLKRGNPRTNRRNAGAAYHGCLQMRVTLSAELYRQIEGWVAGIVAGSNPLDGRTTVAPGRGFEPRFSAPKALVLPG